MARDDALTFDGGALLLRPAWGGEGRGEVRINDARVTATWRDDRGQFVCRQGPWAVRASVDGDGGVALTLTNASPERARLERVTLRWAPEALAPRLETAEYRELVRGLPCTYGEWGVKPVGAAAPFLPNVSPSAMYIVYQREGGDALLLGVVPPVGNALTVLTTLHSAPHMEEHFGVEVQYEFQCVVEPGGSVRTTPLVALTGRDGVRLMEEYGALWGRRLERTPKPVVVGWNSWDYYRGAITRQAMDENARVLRERFGDRAPYVVIDEGWEQQWGTWEPNGKFGDLRDFVRQVKAEGGIPGIWTAPLLVNTYNPLFLEHPDWFTSRRDGQLATSMYAYGPMAYLDISKPEVCAWVSDVFRRLRAMGFEYFKVDFSCQVLIHGGERLADPTLARGDIVRRTFRLIREAIGEECYLMACGVPFESVVGIADGARVTEDMHPFWGDVLLGARALSVHWWMQGNVWNNDPDFLVLRGPDTAEPPHDKRRVMEPKGVQAWYERGPHLREMEARTWALLVHLSGGEVVLSDPLARLKPVALEMIDRVLTPRPRAAVPVDLFETEQLMPRIWISDGVEDTLVGLFNWEDIPTRLDFNPAAYGLAGTLTDFWTGEPVPEIPTRMARRSSLALVYPRRA